ncbi:MAG TPA: PP2C family protein-serine/threonine phosphatase [Trebonia sp.]|nr:PP2C family protein-serine/threonine phosphatase [Trebonia sp.]
MQARAVALSLAITGLVTGIDLGAGPQVGLLPLLSLGPALAPVFLGPAGTCLMGLLALGLGVLIPGIEGQLGSGQSLIAYVAIAGVTAAGTAASAARQRRERELTDERAVADVMRQIFLQPVPAKAGPLRLGVRYASADAAARIGGDLYDVVATAGVVRLIVGDVQGKGLGAVQAAGVVLSAFRYSAYDAASLAEIADHLELSLARQAPDGKFVTAIMAEIPQDGPELTLLNCGHPAPLLLHGGAARFTEPPEAGTPLGLAELVTVQRESYRLPFGPGDRLLFYTDGVSEARDEHGDFYPLDQRGPSLAGLDPEPALDQLFTDIRAYTGHELTDDCLALIVSRVAARSPGPG